MVCLNEQCSVKESNVLSKKSDGCPKRSNVLSKKVMFFSKKNNGCLKYQRSVKISNLL